VLPSDGLSRDPRPAATARARAAPWFQSPFFDVFVRQDAGGDVQWFQRDGANPLKKDAGALAALP
jgi:hypothetical protein